MEQRPLELTLHSAKGLKDIGTFSKMDVYVVVSINGDPHTEQKTEVDEDGGSNPKWKHGSMKFFLDEPSLQMNRLKLKFVLRHERKLAGDKDVGELEVPVKELFDKSGGDNESAQEIDYPVKKPGSDKAKGTIKFSYAFGKVNKIEHQPYAHAGASNEYPAPSRAAEPYPAGHYGGPPPPAAGYPAPGGVAYAAPHPAGYPPPYGPPAGYPPAGGYGYGGYQQPPPYGGYQQPPYGGYPQQQKPQRSGMGAGAGAALGLAGGLVGGMIIGDMISDAGDGFDDMGDF